MQLFVARFFWNVYFLLKTINFLMYQYQKRFFRLIVKALEIEKMKQIHLILDIHWLFNLNHLWFIKSKSIFLVSHETSLSSRNLFTSKSSLKYYSKTFKCLKFQKGLLSKSIYFILPSTFKLINNSISI